jgi:Starch-binding associating with outer membrane
MKLTKHTILLLLGSILIFSCTKKLDEAYINPNAPQTLTPAELLPPIQYQMALNLQEDYMYLGTTVQNFALRYTYLSAGALGTTRDNTISRHEKMGYFPSVDNSGGIWRMHYFNIGQNLNKMVLWATEAGQWDYVAAGQAIQAWSWLTVTDYHGEVILKEAFNTSLLSFKYDTQEEVYAHVRNLCNEALINFDKSSSGGNFAQADQYFFGGDKNKWKKFVYGILARTYQHLSNKAIYNADSVIYYCDKAMQATADDATYKYTGGIIAATNNYWGITRANNQNLRQSKFITELMKGTQGAGAVFDGVDDPRRWYMLTTAPFAAATPTYIDSMFGYEVTKGEGSVTNIALRPNNFYGHTTIPTVDTARFIFRNNAEFPIMTSSEIQFMKAEAALKKGDKPTALAAYKQGISLHFDMLLNKYNVNIRPNRVMTSATRDAFLANPLVVPSPAGLTLSHIMQQKFIALWGHGVLETWTDLRRYHYLDSDPATGKPVYFPFTPPTGLDLWVDNAGQYAYRVRPRYNSEYIWNISEITKIGGHTTDYHTKKMWFSEP